MIRAQEDWSIARECVRLLKQPQTISDKHVGHNPPEHPPKNPVYFSLPSSYYPRIAFHPP